MSFSQTDQEVIDGIKQKNDQILLCFYRKYKRHIFHFVLRQLRDKFLAEEITQDVFMDFIEGIRDFHRQSSLKTFLFSIARHKIVDQIRKKKIKNILFSRLPSYIVESLKVVFIDDEIDKKELKEKICKVLDYLPNDYRLILRLKYIEGVKVKAIAEKLSLRFRAAESLIFRARKAFIKVFNSLP